MQEVRREHHVVTSVPEFRVILRIEVQNVTGTDKTETTGNACCAEEIHKEPSVVKWAVRVTIKA